MSSDKVIRVTTPDELDDVLSSSPGKLVCREGKED
jgi:hypothetical protein